MFFLKNLILSTFRYAHVAGALLPIFIDDKNTPLVFIHIPKTGGTSVFSSLNERIKVLFHDEFGADLPCPPQHFHFALLKRLGITNWTENQIAVVRNPIARFISEFAYRKRVDKNCRWFTLTSFTYFITLAYKHNPYILSNHIRPQYEFIGEGVALYRLEDGLAALLKDYPNYFKQYVDLKTHKNASHSYLQTIDPRALDRLTAFYQKDMSLFRYDSSTIKIAKESTIKHTYHKFVGLLAFLIYRVFK